MSDDDYGFEYSDDDQEEEDVNIENRYYNAKGDLAEDVDAALAGFKEVVSMEDEKGEWGFKAYKQMVKLHFKRGKHEEMMKAYKQMLTYIKSAVTRNYSEKASQTRGGEAAPPPAVCLALRSPSPTTALRAGDQQGA